MRIKTFIAIFAFSSILVPTSSRAQLVVSDPSGLAQQILSVQKAVADALVQADQLVKLNEQYLVLIDSYNKAVEEVNAITGAKGISAIFNDAAAIFERQAASSMDDIINGGVTGDPVGGNDAELNTQVAQIRAELELADMPVFAASPEPRDRGIARRAGSAVASIATANDGYKRANEAGDRLTDLVNQIDTMPDLKASVDLNTRMNAEVLAVLVELLRVQSVQANASAAEIAARAKDEAEARKYLQVD